MKKKISFVSGCYNEADNLEEVVRRVFAVAERFPQYVFEYLIIDNKSTDGSADLLRRLAAAETRIKVILNVRNFGHIRSPYYGMLQARGDAIIYLASDLQDPPEIMAEFIPKWEEGWKVVAAIKTGSEESPVFYLVRKAYYELVSRISDLDLLKNFTGFGLYDRVVVEHLRNMEDPYPYHRGMISELGYPVAKIPFHQAKRKRGFSKNNFYTLYDIAMLGFTSHSKIPLRLATMLGFLFSVLFALVGTAYLALKLIYWEQFALGVAPLIIGLFFIGAVQLFFIGVLGEYIGAIHTKVSKRPLVVEQERINFLSAD
jgi:glycosyltransferase involved in cell wall biosynthesis